MRINGADLQAKWLLCSTCGAGFSKRNGIMQSVINIDGDEKSPTLGFTFNFNQLQLTQTR